MRDARLSLGQLVVILTIFVIIAISLGWDATIPWHPWSWFGFSTDASGRVTSVKPGYPAARAGIHVGDSIDLTTTPAGARRWLVGQYPGITQSSGVSATFTVEHGSAARPVTLASQVRPRSLADNLSLLLSTFGSFVFLAVCTILLLLRPSGITWAFFFLGAGTTAWGATTLPAILPIPAVYWYAAFVDVLAMAASFGFLLFALRFPREPVQGWKRITIRSAPFIFPLAAAASVYVGLAPGVLGTPLESLWRLVQSIQVALYAVGSLALLDSYVRLRGVDRQRTKWVIAGLVVGFGGMLADQILSDTSWLSYSPPVWMVNALDALPVLAALAVAYAVIKHHVIDIRFVISRALAYGILTSLLVVVFALIDFILGKVFEQTKLALVGEIAAAIAAGFWIDHIHRTVDRTIDSLLFRHRHRAQKRLERVAAGLPHAATRAEVNEFLIDEPVAALSLTSGALFQRNELGEFARVAAIGWPATSLAPLRESSAILVPLQGELGPVRIDETRWHEPSFPRGEARPVLAVPILVRHEINGIALYGMHVSGEDLDPDEVKAISTVARAASAACTRLESDELREEIAKLKAEKSRAWSPQPI
jgi:hypothetical protein